MIMTTARKEDKLRPYRIDYFDVNEMNAPDFALVRSEVVRAVTAEEAIYGLVGKPETWSADPRPLVVIRAYRFYKKLGAHKQNVFKSVEDLFPANKAVEVMDVIESYRKKTQATNDLGNTPAAQAQMDALSAQADAATAAPEPAGHITRFSDSSLYDEVCTKCGATDASGKLSDPCPAAPIPIVAPVVSPTVVAEPDVTAVNPDGTPWQRPVPQTVRTVEGTYPTTGPDSPATVAVVADLNGMLSHDEHEQAMDTFVPTLTEGITTPQLQAAVGTKEPFTVRTSDGTLGTLDPASTNAAKAAQVPAAPVDETKEYMPGCSAADFGIIGPDQAVGSEGRPPLCAMPDADSAESPVLAYLAVAALLVLAAAGVFFVLHH